ncbi:MAG TPA: S41 family peptidase [Phycisphaerales bacterium]|nr:S41 family peptidase [Phycisphaerales bacterium]
MRKLNRFVAALLPVLFVGGSVVQARPAGTDQAHASAASETLAEWSQEVWSSAQAGGVKDAMELFADVPGGESPATAELRESIEHFKQTIAKREELRQTRLGEVRKELTENLEKGNLTKSLRAAVEIHLLSPDGEKKEFLESDEIKGLIEKAVERAHADETAGKWLDAHETFSLLNALHDEDRTYRPDLKRLGQRLVMLRLYTPARLHEMRNQQRIAAGDKELPPFNGVGENWEDKLKGIDQSMVKRAMANAAEMNVDQVGLDRMLLGAFAALRTMVTTSDLSAVFPALADKDKLEAFTTFLDESTQRITERGERVGADELIRSVDRLLKVNSTTLQISESALLHEFGNGGIGELDEFTSIIWPDELAQFQRTTEGKFIGVGIQITLNDALDLKVVTPLDGTPAQKAGVRPGDLIRKIDGESTLGISLPQAVDRITGRPGTEVVLSMEREGCEEPIEYRLIRQDIPLYSVKGWERSGPHETDWSWFIDDSSKIGYLRLSQFTKDTTNEMKRATRAMMDAGLRGLILDLRFNPGGLLPEAVGVVSLFAESGTVVTQEDAAGREVERQVVRPGNAALAHLPVVVIVNGGSASASEIVSGALQDYKKAIILGDRSFGKGSVQQVFSLGPRAAFKITSQYYRLPGGRLIHRRDGCTTWGIEPDVAVEMLPKQIGDALTLRQDADISRFDAEGKKVVDEKHPGVEARKLLDDGLDPQLEAAVLLVRSQLVGGPTPVVQSTK